MVPWSEHILYVDKSMWFCNVLSLLGSYNILFGGKLLTLHYINRWINSISDIWAVGKLHLLAFSPGLHYIAFSHLADAFIQSDLTFKLYVAAETLVLG